MYNANKIDTGCSENIAKFNGQKNCLDSVCENYYLWFVHALKCTAVQRFPEYTHCLFFPVGHYREEIKPVQSRE